MIYHLLILKFSFILQSQSKFKFKFRLNNAGIPDLKKPLPASLLRQGNPQYRSLAANSSLMNGVQIPNKPKIHTYPTFSRKFTSPLKTGSTQSVDKPAPQSSAQSPAQVPPPDTKDVKSNDESTQGNNFIYDWH